MVSLHHTIAAAGLAVLCGLPARALPLDPATVATLVAEAGTTDDYPDAATVTVLDRTTSDVEESGLAHVDNRVVIKVLTRAGAVATGTQRFDYDPATQLIEIRTVRVHRADGTWEDVDPARAVDVSQPAHMIYWGARMRVLQLPRLAVGDAVELETYRKGYMIAYLGESQADDDSRYIPPMRGHWYDVQLFQSNVPMREKTVTVRLPRTRPLQYQVVGGEVFSESTFDVDHFTYRFWKQDCPPLPHEWRGANARDTAPKVVMTTVADWPAKSRWFWEANARQFDATPEIRALVTDITHGLKSDEAKVAALNHWAAQNIRYCGLNMGEGEGYTLHPGPMILRERSGVCKDIAGMAITLCRTAGYEVYPAMTMAGARVEHTPADQFNHCVGAWKKADGTWEMLDPTWIPFSRFAWSRMEGEQDYVVGTPTGEELASIRAFTADDNAVALTLHGDLASDGTLRARVALRPNGAADTRLRRAIGETPRDQVESRLRSWCASLGAGAELVSWRAGDPLDFDHAMDLDLEVRVPGYATVGDRTVTWCSPAATLATTDYGGVVRLAGARADVDDETRTTPVFLWMAQAVTLDEDIRVPRGFTTDTDAPDRAPTWLAGHSGDIASCHLRAEPDGKTMRVRGTMQVARRVVPAADWLLFRAAVTAFADAASTRLVARRKGA